MEPDLKPLVAAVLVAAILIGGAALLFVQKDSRAPQLYAVPGLEPMTAADVAAESYRVAPAMLSRVYAAFGETEENAIYDGLALVAAGDALEALYLERVGAMADGGLEPDQTLHEMEMMRIDGSYGGEKVTLDARWRVLGTVGHAEHLHVRGNAYSADLRLEPVNGAWRITGFELTDVDRTGAGETQQKVDNPQTVLGVAN